MPYVGSQPTVGNFVKLDAIVTSATATYNLLNGGVAYTPASVLNLIVSLNGVIQEPTTASNVGGFTVSGSTIVFTSALTSLDVIDFILVLGDVLNIGTPSDGTVTFPKVTSNLITGATAETSIDGADNILIYDDSATALRKMTRTNFVSGLGAAAGQVIQVLGATDTTARTTTSATFVTGSNTLSVSITPSSASNKILILCSTAVTQGGDYAFYTIKRDSTDLGATSNKGMAVTYIVSTSNDGMTNIGIHHLDSPNTTSAITYQLYIRCGSGVTINNQNSKGNLTCLEIKG